MQIRSALLALALVHCAAQHRIIAPPPADPRPFAGAIATDATIPALATAGARAAPLQVELAPEARAQWSVVRDQRVDAELRSESILSITSTRGGAVYLLLAQRAWVGAEATLVQIEPDHIETFPARPGALLATEDALSLRTFAVGAEPPQELAFDRARGFIATARSPHGERPTADADALLSSADGARARWRLGSSNTFERGDDPSATLRFEGRTIAVGVDSSQLRPWVVSERDDRSIDWTRVAGEQWTRSTLYAPRAAGTGCASAPCAVEHALHSVHAYEDGLLVVHRETLGSLQTQCGMFKPSPCARCRTAPMPRPVCREVFVPERASTALELRSSRVATRIAWLPEHLHSALHVDAQGSIHLAILSLAGHARAELRYATIAPAPDAPRASAIPVRQPARATRVEHPSATWDLVAAGWSASGALVHDGAALTGDGFGQLLRELRVGDRFVGRGRFLERCGFSGLAIDLRGERSPDVPWTYALALRTDALVLRAGSAPSNTAPTEGYVDSSFDATRPHEYAIERTADAIITSIDQREVSRVTLRGDGPVSLRLATPPTEAMQWLEQARPGPRDCARVPSSAISWSEIDWNRR